MDLCKSWPCRIIMGKFNIFIIILNINTLIQKKKFPRFETTRYSLYVYGLCNKCIAQQKKAGKH